MKRTGQHLPILPVILAGGEGLRLAPIAGPDRPKPFIPLPDGRSLLAHTLARAAQLPGALPPLVVGHYAHRYALLNHARSVGAAPAILLEPMPRNTALAMASATHTVLRTHGDAMLAVLPADQMIAPASAWLQAVADAAHAAATHAKPCLLGVVPTRPDPHFGYLMPGAPLPGTQAVTVDHFIEKPEEPSGFWLKGLWNAGQFIVPARVLADLFTMHLPAIWEAARLAVETAEQQWEFTCLGFTPYQQAAPHSFDRAVVERAEMLAVRLSAHWHDLGTVESWEAFTGRPAASYAEDPPRTDRPWGYYEWLAATPDRLEKRLVIFPGCRLSLQRHRHREETWQVLEGTAQVTRDGAVQRLEAGSHIHIPAWTWHRLENPGAMPLIIHEIQTGNPDEADIERLADDYGRVTDTKNSA